VLNRIRNMLPGDVNERVATLDPASMLDSSDGDDLDFDLDDDDDDGDDGDDDDSDDDEDDEDELDTLIRLTKTKIANDPISALAGGRIIFQRDKTDPDSIIMIARIDAHVIPEEVFDVDGNEMWEADFILRLQGSGHEDPEKRLPKIDGRIFKKKNWVPIEG